MCSSSEGGWRGAEVSVPRLGAPALQVLEGVGGPAGAWKVVKFPGGAERAPGERTPFTYPAEMTFQMHIISSMQMRGLLHPV